MTMLMVRDGEDGLPVFSCMLSPTHIGDLIDNDGKGWGHMPLDTVTGDCLDMIDDLVAGSRGDLELAGMMLVVFLHKMDLIEIAKGKLVMFASTTKDGESALGYKFCPSPAQDAELMKRLANVEISSDHEAVRQSNQRRVTIH